MSLLGYFLLPLQGNQYFNIRKFWLIGVKEFEHLRKLESIFMADIKTEYLACPIRQVVSRFGDKWSMLVLYLLHTSKTGVLRFNEIRRFMTDCSQKMLSQTLKNLEQSHLVHREVYPEVPPRVEYSLTATGKSLMPAINALIVWGKEHFDEIVQKD